MRTCLCFSVCIECKSLQGSEMLDSPGSVDIGFNIGTGNPLLEEQCEFLTTEPLKQQFKYISLIK